MHCFDVWNCFDSTLITLVWNEFSTLHTEFHGELVPPKELRTEGTGESSSAGPNGELGDLEIPELAGLHRLSCDAM